jgi:hypothetical protein
VLWDYCLGLTIGLIILLKVGCGLPSAKGLQGRRGPPAEELPPDAAPTIYVDGLPMDVNKRELAHIFRPFQGYLVSRALVLLLGYHTVLIFACGFETWRACVCGWLGHVEEA